MTKTKKSLLTFTYLLVTLTVIICGYIYLNDYSYSLGKELGHDVITAYKK